MLSSPTDIFLVNQHYKDVNPLLCGFEQCLPSHTFGPASRACYLLHYVKSGRGYFETPRGRYAVEAGQLFVIRPLEITLYRADSIRPWHYCWIGFECSPDFRLPPALDADVLEAGRCGHLFASMAGAENIASGRELYLCGKIYELLAALSETSAREQGREYALRAKNYIESNYVSSISVEGLARDLGLDRSYFCRLFKKYIGLSPQKYLVDFRLQRAAELIAAHGYSPGEAARSAGYRDIVNFSRMFSRRFGAAPSVYGKRPRAKEEYGGL